MTVEINYSIRIFFRSCKRWIRLLWTSGWMAIVTVSWSTLFPTVNMDFIIIKKMCCLTNDIEKIWASFENPFLVKDHTMEREDKALVLLLRNVLPKQHIFTVLYLLHLYKEKDLGTYSSAATVFTRIHLPVPSVYSFRICSCTDIPSFTCWHLRRESRLPFVEVSNHFKKFLFYKTSLSLKINRLLSFHCHQLENL